MRKSIGTLQTAVVLILMVCATLGAEDGIVAEKPASGPFVQTGKGFMVPYAQIISGTNIRFEMIPIPGGKFRMGSPESEVKRNNDEGPQFEVIVEPFWMAKHEVTWEQYKYFMDMYRLFKDFEFRKIRIVSESNRADAVTVPTPLYDPDKTFERGDEPNEPAVTMTPYAARQFSKWLSGITGHFYRLPAEAEWEYACRAGSETAYSFGGDPRHLDDHAWHFANSIKKFPDSDEELEAYHAVGSKKPNAFGLYDMHGNVSELVLDEYRNDHYKQFAGKTVKALDTIAWPTRRSPRVHRGGSWDSDPEDCRSAARGQTDDEEWKLNDPNRHKSPWWYTEEESRAVGFRLIRPLDAPASTEERNKYWEETVEEVVLDVKTLLEYHRRGVLGLVDKDLPAAIKSHNK